MQPQAEDRAVSREGGRRLARRPVHHQARAREDAAIVWLADAEVDAGTHAEVVSGDDEPLHERVPLATAASSSARSAPAAGSGRSARLTARACSRTRATTWRASNSSASSRAS